MLILDVGPNVAYNQGSFSWFWWISSGSKILLYNCRYWFAFILVSFLMLLVTNSDVFRFFPIPLWMSIFIFILPPFGFWPFSEKFYAWIWCSSLFLFYIMNVLGGKPRSEEELAMVSKVNTGVGTTIWPCLRRLQRIESASDRSRFTIPGTRANRDLGRFRCCQVFDWYRSQSGKEQVKSVSEVVREGTR